MKDNTQKRVALYIRVSSDQQKNEGLSLEAQKKTLEDYCKIKDYYAFKIYTDAGISAKNIDQRPQFKELLKDAQNNKFKAVLITKFDRAFRNSKDAILTLDLFNKLHIDIISLGEGIDTTTPMGEMIFTIISAFATFERKLTSIRVKDVNNYRHQTGLIIGKAPVGYKFNKKEKKYVIDEKNAIKVLDIFEMTMKGIRWKDICEKHKISPQTYYNIIRNKTYIGLIEYQGIEKKGNHEPIVSEEVFNLANSKINKKV